MLRRILGTLTVLLLAACTAPAPARPALTWTPVTLPTAGRITLRDAVACDDGWYVVGARLGADADDTSPAAWFSGDARTWRAVPFAPLPGSYYGPKNVITNVACAGSRVVLVGSKGGGAHGNQRVSTWTLRGDGTFAEVSAPFDTYGGDTAVNVGHLTGGPRGFQLAGNRTTGAAAWLSVDGRTFRLYEDAPGLAGRTAARDGTQHDGRWLLVGSAGKSPAAWTSPDGGSWTAQPVPTRAGFAELQRVAPAGDGLIAVGPHDTALAAWRGPPWTEQGIFGTGEVRSLAVTGPDVLVAATDLWHSPDTGGTWQPIPTPAPPQAVAARNRTVLLAGADRAWIGTLRP